MSWLSMQVSSQVSPKTISKIPQLNVIPFPPPLRPSFSPPPPAYFANKLGVFSHSPGQNPLKRRWPNPYWPNLVWWHGEAQGTNLGTKLPLPNPTNCGTWSLSATHLTPRTFNRFDDLPTCSRKLGHQVMIYDQQSQFWKDIHIQCIYIYIINHDIYFFVLYICQYIYIYVYH